MKHRLLTFICFIVCLSSCLDNHSDDLILHYYQLDEGLKKSNAFIHTSIIDMIYTMEETCKTKTQYIPLIEKAKEAVDIATNLSEFIDTLKAELIKKTGGTYSKEEALIAQDSLLERVPKGAKNTSITREILLTGSSEDQNKLSKATLLDQKMQTFLEQYIILLESCWQPDSNERPPIEGTIFSGIRKKEQTIQQLQNQFTLKTSKDFILTQEEDENWAESTFGNKPLILVLNNLTAIQNQLETTQHILINFFNSQIPLDSYSNYDRFEILAYSPQTSVRIGETYETEIALGVYSSQSIFQVIIGQDTLQSIDGKVIYRARPNKLGEQKYTAQISIANPITGETERFSKEFSFHVIP